MTASLPRQAVPRDEPPRPPEDPRHKARRRAITLLTIVLLIGVPAVYLAISANQSRNSGKDKEYKYSATGLTVGWPSKVQRRLYQVPVPHPAEKVAFYETNNWKTSRLYVQFETTDAGLDTFLAGINVDRGTLKKKDITISARDQKITGWKFTRPGPWWGVVNKQKDPAPTQDIVVNLSDPKLPMVYVVSRTVP
ncbi:sugar kinase [Streptomyces sp. NPDC051572]|uniref:sugar kinase n=1 Tax=Streptomyces sp. NPDC051572 TaxID=3155802 RepID=UPI00344FCA9B